MRIHLNLTSCSCSAANCASQKCLSIEGNVVKTTDRKFHFDSITIDEPTFPPLPIEEEFFSGKSVGFVCLGANCNISLNANRQTWMANQLRAFEGRLIATLGDPSFFSQLSFSYIGISDHRVIDLVSDRQIPVCRLKHGLPESFFEPIKDLKQPISLIEQGCSTPGMIMAIKLERLPIRLAVNIEKAMEDDRNAYRSLCNWNPPTDRDIGVPKASILYLVNLGDIWFTQAIPGHIPSLSKSVLVLRKAIETANFEFNKFSEHHALSAILCDLFGGSVRGTLVIDMENECISALEFSQLLRLVRNRTSFVHFDERIPLLWQMEHRLKQLHRDNERIKKAFDELKDKFTSLQQDSTDRIAELQRKETEILELNKRYSGATEQLKELQHTYRSQLSEFQSSCEKAEKALDFFKKRCNELETENIAAKASYEKSAEKANHLTVEWEKEQRRLKMEIDDLKKRNDVALEKNSRKEDKKLIRLENEVEKLRKEKAELIERVANAEVELEAVKSRCETTSMQAQSSSKRSSRVRKSKADHILTNDQDSESEGKDPPASRPKLQKQLDSTLAADRAVDVESKPRREKTDKLSEKENFPGVVEKSLAKVSDEGTKAPIMLGSLINPEAFQKIRANFSLPKLKK